MPFQWLFSSGPLAAFRTHEQLFEALRKMDPHAVAFIQRKVLPVTQKWIRQYQIDPASTEDLLNKGTLILLQKIQSGAYQFQGYSPTTYLAEIMRHQILSATRSRRLPTDPLENHLLLTDEEKSAQEARSEAAEMVGLLLEKLGTPCSDIIRLHHIEGYSDEEVIAQKMTAFTTKDSLKVKRSFCMKKLIGLAQKWKTSTHI
jgi:RNA polymerase sigma factor (sigma-70 family)